MHIHNTNPARSRHKPRTPLWRGALRGLLAAAALAAAGGALAQTAAFTLPSGSYFPTQAVPIRVVVDNNGGATSYTAGQLQYKITGLPTNVASGDFACADIYSTALCDTITVVGTTLTMPLKAINNTAIGGYNIILTLPATVATGSQTLQHSVEITATSTPIAVISGNGGTHNFTINVPGGTDPTIGFPSASVVVNQGGVVSGTLTVNNTGGVNIAVNTLEYTIGNLLAVGAHSPVCTNCQSPPTIDANGVLRARLPAIAAGATANFTVSYTVANTASLGAYTETHNVSNLATALPAHSRNVTVQASGTPPSPPLPGETSLTPVTVPTGAGNVVLSFQINNTGGTALSNVSYQVTELPAGADVFCSAPSGGVTCGARTGAGGGTQSIPLGTVAANSIASFTITYPVTATTPAHAGQHVILAGTPATALPVSGGGSVMPFSWSASAGGAFSVPAVAPLGLLLMSLLLAAGVPAAVVRRRRK